MKDGMGMKMRGSAAVQKKTFRIPVKAVILGMLAGALLLAGALYASGALTPAPDIHAGSGGKSSHDQNRELSNGYAQLYRISSGLKHLDKILYVKVESDKIESVVKAVANYADELSEQLEKLQEDYPSLNIKDTGLPEMDLKRRKAIIMDRLEDMAPIVGKTGKEYELTLLISVMGPINSMRFLAEVLTEEEKNQHRAVFAARTKDRLDGLFHRILALLEKDYFCLTTRK
jgi:uncharacterized transporter YbjL